MVDLIHASQEKSYHAWMKQQIKAQSSSGSPSLAEYATMSAIVKMHCKRVLAAGGLRNDFTQTSDLPRTWTSVIAARYFMRDVFRAAVDSVRSNTFARALVDSVSNESESFKNTVRCVERDMPKSSCGFSRAQLLSSQDFEQLQRYFEIALPQWNFDFAVAMYYRRPLKSGCPLLNIASGVLEAAEQVDRLRDKMESIKSDCDSLLLC
jgi:hypothetical protein